jgi:hypothetical protein
MTVGRASSARWIIACLQAGPGPVPPPRDLDWKGTLARAGREDLLPALAWAFRDSPQTVPADIGARFMHALREARARHALMLAELRALLDAFDAAGVVVVPLKGPLLAETLYPEPALRPCHDLDLLVRAADRHAANRLLETLGYRYRADEHTRDFDLAFDLAAAYDGPRGVRVDLHWSLLGDTRFAWQHAEQAAIWERVTPRSIAGRRALVLAREDLLLALASHLAIHHAASGLRWYWDIARLVERGMDWGLVAERATAWHVRRALGVVLQGVEEWFGVRALVDVRTLFAVSGLRARAVRWLTQREHAHGAAEYLLPLLLTDASGDAVREIGRAAVPAPTWLRARYGERSVAALYVAHGRRLVSVARGAMALASPRRSAM